MNAAGPLGGFKPAGMPKAPTGYQGSRIAGYLASGMFPGGDQFQTPPQTQSAYDFSQDPALQTILATDAAARSNAQAAAFAAEKQLAVQLGDATGILNDRTTAKEAAQNPFSTLASLAKAYKQTRFNTDQAANENNLYYSGARAKQVAADAYTYQHQQYDARQAALNALASIQENLAAANGAANTNDAAGYQQAYTTAAGNAATYGYDPGAAHTAPTASGLQKQLAQPRGPQSTQHPVTYPQATSPAFRMLNQTRLQSLRLPPVR